MPKTDVFVFQQANGVSPLLDWLESLRQRDPEAWAKCLQRILLLAERGIELRRPHADYLEDRIYELRLRHVKKQYRILYFFCPGKRHTVVLSGGLQKEDAVPKAFITEATDRLELVEKNFDKYTVTFKVK